MNDEKIFELMGLLMDEVTKNGGCCMCRKISCSICISRGSNWESVPCSLCYRGILEFTEYKPDNYCSNCGRKINHQINPTKDKENRDVLAKTHKRIQK